MPHTPTALITGFARPNRSYYLDDMVLVPGDLVVCRSDLTGVGFTANKAYVVREDGTVVDDLGETVRPSARFTYAPTPHQHA